MIETVRNSDLNLLNNNKIFQFWKHKEGKPHFRNLNFYRLNLSIFNYRSSKTIFKSSLNSLIYWNTLYSDHFVVQFYYINNHQKTIVKSFLNCHVYCLLGHPALKLWYLTFCIYIWDLWICTVINTKVWTMNSTFRLKWL